MSSTPLPAPQAVLALRSQFRKVENMFKILSVIALVFSGIVPPALALDPLEKVEQDQSGDLISSRNIFNSNLLIGSRPAYTHVSSYKPGSFGSFAHDGDERKVWIVNPAETKGIIQISWGLAVPIDQVKILEHKGGNIVSLKLELYDGRGWTVVEPESTSARGRFNFPVRPASALRISLETKGEAGIAEVEVFNTQSTAPLARYGGPELVAAMKNANAVILSEGSPYAFSRAGRVLIQPRNPEACLADPWTRPVLEFIGTSLGGSVESAGPESLKIDLNGHSVSLTTEPGTNIVDRIQALATEAGLEFKRQGPLVMVGSGLEALEGSEVSSQLTSLLGRNPYLTRASKTPAKNEKRGLIERIKSFFSGTSQAEAPPPLDAKPDAIITPTMATEGITYEWAGFRAMADPDTNSDAWLKYSEAKSARSWAGSTRYMNSYVRPKAQVESAEDFEALKSEIRAAPETNGIIAMRAFLKKHHEQLAAEFKIYNTLGISLINATGPKDWPDTLHDDFINWAGCYAMTYYLAKNYGIAAHQYGNEPDGYFNKSTDEQIARRLTLVADAVHCAIEDVNRDHNRNLKAVFSAPVLASDFTGRNARIMMRNLYTRYDGTPSPTPLFQLFNRHRYGGRPHQNALEVAKAKQMMQEEAGEVLPQVFTELNYSTGGHWGLPKTTFLNDSPAVFTSMASIWGCMMQEQGVFGIFVFKMNDSGVWSRNGTGPFSNTITYSMFPEQDPEAEPKKKEQISYGSKNFEVCRLFSRGFHGSRPLLKTEIACSDPEYRAWTTFDEESGRYYIWSVQIDSFAPYELEFDLSKLDLPQDALVTAEMVSGAHHGEMTLSTTLPQDRKIRVRQPAQSAMLLTIHKRPLKQESIAPEADAMVVQGEQSQANFGAEKTLRIGRNARSGANAIGFLKFKLPEGDADIQRAVLELHGQSKSAHAYDGGFLFRVYAVEKGAWDEQTITAENAPGVNKTVSAMKKIDMKNYPLGHVTCFNTPSQLLVDVTQAVREARENDRDEVDFVLIREVHWPNENTDSVSAILSSREAGPSESPSLHLWQ